MLGCGPGKGWAALSAFNDSQHAATDAFHRLFSLPYGAEAESAAREALDAGALLLLAGVVRKSARAASDGDSEAKTACSYACGWVGALLASCDEMCMAAAAAR